MVFLSKIRYMGVVLSHTRLLVQAHEVAELASILKKETRFAFDTEFIRESTFYPQIELIQIATQQDSWIVDARAFKKNHIASDSKDFDAGMVPLLEVFQDPSILKVVHAAQGDQEVIYSNFHVLPAPIVDTAIAASLCGLGQSVGLGKALKEVLGLDLQKGHARTNWSMRPLSRHLIEYAHGDVVHLLELWDALLLKLDALDRRRWAFEQSALWTDPERFEWPLLEVARKGARQAGLDSKGASVFKTLLEWREKRAQQLNLPRRWLAEESVLINLAQVRPASLEHLGSFRGLNRGELQKQGQVLLELIQEAQKTPLFFEKKHQKKGGPFEMSGGRVLSGEEEAVLHSLLGCFVHFLAQKYHIASSFLLSSPQSLQLLRNFPWGRVAEGEQEASWRSLLVTSLAPPVWDLIGEDLCDFLMGRSALRFNNNQVEVIQGHGNSLFSKGDGS